MNYGEVALGVECALPARFEASTRRRRSRSLPLWLLFVLAAGAIL
ncbi:MAG TPA: hypothetical protein VGP71_05345 [Burkholderiales bacterium]|jgi:hypothetical protein|nr:hypothetical protein [Burkholderiales bacterium]